MTFRAVILGVVWAVFIAGVGYLNDEVLQSTFLVGNHFPIGVFGGLIVFLLAVNPVLHRIRGSWRLRPGELAVAVAFALVACSIPGSSLMRTFLPSLVMPIRYNAVRAGWRKANVLGYVPPGLMPPDDPEVVDGFYSGLARSGEMISITDVPWAKWAPTLMTYVPLIMGTAIGVICMALIVHRQWAFRERLRYPIVVFTNALTEQTPDSPAGPIFRNRLFWMGFLVLLTVRVVNGIYAWTEQSTIEIPLRFEFNEITQKWPVIQKSLSGLLLTRPRFYPTMVAFVFLLASDIGFSLGISQVLFATLQVGLLTAGVALTQERLGGGAFTWQRFGSYVGVALMLVYIGRRYYWDVVKQSVTFRPQKGVDPSAAWALRILFVVTVAMILFLAKRVGLDWPFAVLFVLLMWMIFLVMSRLNAECGVIYLQAGWHPVAVLVGLFGLKALGPEALVISGLVCTVLVLDPRECLMPFVINGLKMCDDTGVKASRVGWWGIGVFALCLAVAIPVVFWADYNWGVPTWDKWAVEWLPPITFDAVEKTVNQLKQAGELAQSEGFSAWERITHMEPSGEFLWAAGAGLGLALLCSIMRLRYSRWPLHPILFLVWGTWPLCLCSHSFMLGWLIKTAVTKFGGSQTYRRVTGLMIGVIAGDLLGGLTFAVISAGYGLVTGIKPVAYAIFPT